MIAETCDLTVRCDDPHGIHRVAPTSSWQAMTRTGCRQQASASGWRIEQPDTAICPACVKRKESA